MIRILCVALESPLQLAGAECHPVADWQAARSRLEEPFDAVVCGLWCPSGLEAFAALDAAQVVGYLRSHYGLPCYLVLSPLQADFAAALQGVAQAVVVVGNWQGAWRGLQQRVRQDFGLTEESLPCNEILLAREGQPQYQFQCLQPELRADLATFLELKGRSLEKHLALGSLSSCSLEGEDMKGRVRFLGPAGVLWTAHQPPGPAYPQAAGETQQRQLEELGVSL